ncbi:MAG: hypothetical protein Kow00121_04740 [Elainellaceae cyanobacterium]
MTFTEPFSYSLELMETCEGGEFQHRLKLYQVFLKIYEHHKGLLDEILSLEHSGSKTLSSVTLPYVQGIVLDQTAHLITNLLQGETQVLHQPQHTWVIGRDPHQVLIPVQDGRLSRCHAALKYVENQGFYLIDLNSRNGSYVNGEPIRESRLLQDGDRVRLGSLTFIFFLCQSARSLRSLPADAAALLENWQPPKAGSFGREGLDLSAADNLMASSLLDETSRFMRPSQVY